MYRIHPSPVTFHYRNLPKRSSLTVEFLLKIIQPTVLWVKKIVLKTNWKGLAGCVDHCLNWNKFIFRLHVHKMIFKTKWERALKLKA